MKNPLLYTWLKLQTGLSNKHNSMSAFDMVGEKKYYMCIVSNNSNFGNNRLEHYQLTIERRIEDNTNVP